MYKTHLERVSHGWTHKVGDFERINMNLTTEVARLQQENDQLKTKVSIVLNQAEDTINFIFYVSDNRRVRMNCQKSYLRLEYHKYLWFTKEAAWS